MLWRISLGLRQIYVMSPSERYRRENDIFRLVKAQYPFFLFFIAMGTFFSAMICFVIQLFTWHSLFWSVMYRLGCMTEQLFDTTPYYCPLYSHLFPLGLLDQSMLILFGVSCILAIPQLCLGPPWRKTLLVRAFVLFYRGDGSPTVRIGQGYEEHQN